MFSTLRKLETARIHSQKRKVDFGANLGTLAARWNAAGEKAQQFREAYEPIVLQGKVQEMQAFESAMDSYCNALLARARKDNGLD